MTCPHLPIAEDPTLENTPPLEQEIYDSGKIPEVYNFIHKISLSSGEEVRVEFICLSLNPITSPGFQLTTDQPLEPFKSRNDLIEYIKNSRSPSRYGMSVDIPFLKMLLNGAKLSERPTYLRGIFTPAFISFMNQFDYGSLENIVKSACSSTTGKTNGGLIVGLHETLKEIFNDTFIKLKDFLKEPVSNPIAQAFTFFGSQLESQIKEAVGASAEFLQNVHTVFASDCYPDHFEAEIRHRYSMIPEIFRLSISNANGVLAIDGQELIRAIVFGKASDGRTLEKISKPPRDRTLEISKNVDQVISGMSEKNLLVIGIAGFSPALSFAAQRICPAFGRIGGESAIEPFIELLQTVYAEIIKYYFNFDPRDSEQ